MLDFESLLYTAVYRGTMYSQHCWGNGGRGPGRKFGIAKTEILYKNNYINYLANFINRDIVYDCSN